MEKSTYKEGDVVKLNQSPYSDRENENEDNIYTLGHFIDDEFINSKDHQEEVTIGILPHWIKEKV